MFLCIGKVSREFSWKKAYSIALDNAFPLSFFNAGLLNWNQTKTSTKYLQEVKLSIFDIGNCSEILKRTNSTYNLDMELCAG